MTRRDLIDMLILLPVCVGAAFVLWIVIVAWFSA